MIFRSKLVYGILIMALYLCAACSGTSSMSSGESQKAEEELWGKWVFTFIDNGNEYYAFDLEFSEDGHLLSPNSEKLSATEVSYRLISPGKLRVINSGKSEILDYELSGNLLIIYFDKGYNQYIRGSLMIVDSPHEEERAATSSSSSSPIQANPITEAMQEKNKDKKVITPENTDQVIEIARFGYGSVIDLVFTPDGKHIAMATNVGVFFFTTEELREVYLFDQNCLINSIDVSPDSFTLAVACEKVIYLFDIDSRSVIKTIELDSKYDAIKMKFSPDGTLLFIVNIQGYTFKLLDVNTGQEIHHRYLGKYGQLFSIAFSSDGKVIATGGSDSVSIWDIGSEKRIKVFEGLEFHQDIIALSPDGKTVASCNSNDGMISLWDVISGQELHKLVGVTLYETISRPLDLTFSPDGKTLVSGNSDGLIHLWDVDSGAEINSLSSSGWGRKIVYSQNGQFLASASTNGKLRIWDIENKIEVNKLDWNPGVVNCVAFSLDGNTLAMADYSGIYLWDIMENYEVRKLESLSLKYSWWLSLSFAPNGNTLASGSKHDGVLLWDYKNGLERRILERDECLDMNDISYSPNGRFIAAGTSDGSICVWELKNRDKLSILRGHKGSVTGISFSPDGNILASGSLDRTIRLWDIEGGSEISRIYVDHGGVRSVVFSPDGGTIVAGIDDFSIRFWDLLSGSEITSLWGHINYVNIVAFSPDGNLLVSGSNDNTIRLWDARKGIQLSILKGHKDLVTSVAFSPDGAMLASGSDDRTVRIWQIP